MDNATVYAAITKMEKQADGTLLVWGPATTTSLDIDEQVCDGDWLSRAMPAWFKYGNIREQHSAIAAGVAEEYSEKADGVHEIVARVVDPSSVKKVETKVLKGFSIGIRRPRVVSDKAAPGGRIVDGEIVEVSLVDRPANPDCMLTLAKAATVGVETAPADFDAERMLVRVEDYREKAAENEPLEGAPVDLPVDATDPASAVSAVVDAEGSAAGAPADSDATPGEGNSDADAGAPEDGAPAAAEAAQEPAAEAAVGDGPAAGDGAGSGDEKAATITLDAEGIQDLVRKQVTAMLGKRDYSADDRKRLAGTGAAMPGGGFPVKTVADLKNAIQAIGRAKDPAAAKAHIKARAEALGREDLIPDSWKAAGSEEMAHDPATLLAVRNGLLNLIIAEAHEAMQGEYEVCDLDMLTNALSLFLMWWDGEAWEGEAPTSAETKAADPDAAKGCDGKCCAACGSAAKSADGDTVPVTDEPETAPEQPEVAVSEPEPAPEAPAAAEDADKSPAADPAGSKAVNADTVKAAVAEAMQGALGPLLARLEQVEKAATPGGPVRVRATVAQKASREADAALTEAVKYTALAKTVDDQGIRGEYERRAREAQERADAARRAADA